MPPSPPARLIRPRRLAPAALFLAALLVSCQVAAADALVLVYHRFGPQVTDSMMVRTEAFEAQLREITAQGYQVVPLARVVDRQLNPAAPLPPRAVTISVDDGHRTVYTELFPIIRRLRIPVTLFIYPSAISNASYAMTWEQLAELAASGLVDIQSHSYWHPNFLREKRKLSPETYAAFADDQLAKSKRVLEKRLGGRVDLLAWPFGLEDADLHERAARAGYRAAFTIEARPLRAGDAPMALPRFMITDAVKERDFAALLKRGTSKYTGKMQ